MKVIIGQGSCGVATGAKRQPLNLKNKSRIKT